MVADGFATFHGRAVLSRLALAGSRPSGLKATLRASPVWPARTAIWVRPATSHRRTVLSSPSMAPFGLNATPVTESVWPVRDNDLRAPHDVPQSDRVVHAGGGDRAPIRADREATDPAGVPVEWSTELGAGRCVPQPERSVPAAGCQELAPQAEWHRPAFGGVAGGSGNRDHDGKDAVNGWIRGGLFQRGYDDWRCITTTVNACPSPCCTSAPPDDPQYRQQVVVDTFEPGAVHGEVGSTPPPLRLVLVARAQRGWVRSNTGSCPRCVDEDRDLVCPGERTWRCAPQAPIGRVHVVLFDSSSEGGTCMIVLS